MNCAPPPTSRGTCARGSGAGRGTASWPGLQGDGYDGVISHASSHLACMCGAGAGAATMGWNTCSGSLVAPPRPRLLSVSLEEEE